MGKNANFVSHKKSKLKENGGPKLPLATDLVEGEIAINFGKDVETLSIKNESGDVVTFSSDNYYTEKKLGSGFTGENSGVTVTEALENVEITVDQVIDETTSASTHAVATKAVVDKLIEDEQVWAISLNELNNKKFGYANFDDTSKSIEFYKDSDEASSGVPISTVDLSSFSIDIDQVIDSGTSASTDAVSTSAVYGFVTSYTPSITVDQDFSNTASTNPISTKAVYSAMTENELVWANAFVALSGTVSAHTANTEIHVTAADKARWDSSSDSLWESGSGVSSVVLKGSSGTASGDYSVAEGYQSSGTGQYSHAEGYYTRANGIASHAEGGQLEQGETVIPAPIANGDYSHAEGISTTTSGMASHAEGVITQANGMASHAEGSNTQANGSGSHAEGNGTTASGQLSHAEGGMSKANGMASHAEGSGTIASGQSSHAEGVQTQANGSGSHAEGGGSEANGQSSHAEGSETVASGQSSHAEGRETIANGQSSHAEGYYTRANGDYSHVEGTGTQANNESEHASGQYNVSNSATTEFGDSGNTLFSVGNGIYDESTDTEIRHNAFEIRQNGDIYITSGNSDIKLQDYIGETSVELWESGTGLNSVAQKGGNCTANGICSVAEGSGTTANGNYSHAEGGQYEQGGAVMPAPIANGDYSHVEGVGTTTSASSVASHAEGAMTQANGRASHAEGIQTQANGEFGSHAEGSGTIASGQSSHAEGYQTIALGEYSHAEGAMTQANGDASHAEGSETKANGDGSHAEGIQTQANGYCSHSEGRNTQANGYCSHAEGLGTVANNESEHASGRYNISNSATTTFGDSGNTLFSVGNGSYSTPHNAFEIRQNGDIYITSGNSDIKLQDYIGGGGGSSETITAITPSNSGSTAPIATKVVAENELTVSNALNDLNARIALLEAALGGMTLMKLTSEEYEELTVKDPNTMYIIND